MMSFPVSSSLLPLSPPVSEKMFSASLLKVSTEADAIPPVTATASLSAWREYCSGTIYIRRLSMLRFSFISFRQKDVFPLLLLPATILKLIFNHQSCNIIIG